jgi:hypothetical protein
METGKRADHCPAGPRPDAGSAERQSNQFSKRTAR